MESFNLNIIPGKDRPVCHASQYDIGRTIHVNLFEGFNVFTLDGTEVISISVRKPDGNVVTESVTNTSDSYVEFVTTEQMTACHGSNLCELKLEKGADVIGTMNFILEVEQDPLEGGVQSASEIDNLQTQIAGMVATEVADQYDSANVIFDAAPTPGHGNGYAVTSEGVATELALKQDATDANLQTTDTTIVGAINELNSGKADAATTYTKTEVDNALALKQDTITPVTLNNSLTLHSSVSITNGFITRYGRLVEVGMILKAVGNINNNDILVSNLPRAMSNRRCPRGLGTDQWFANTDYTSGGLAVDIDDNDPTKAIIRNFSNITASAGSPKYIYMSFAYITMN